MESMIVFKEQFLQGGPWEMSDIMKLPSIHDILEVLGKRSIESFFDKYLELRPSAEPIVAKDILPRIFAIIGKQEPTYTRLYKRARDQSSDEPWAECLFVYSVRRYLESRDCPAVAWRSLEYSTFINTAAGQSSQAMSFERYRIVTIILERLLMARDIEDFSEPEPEPETESESESEFELDPEF